MSKSIKSGLEEWRAEGNDLSLCPVRMILDHVAAKWTILVLIELDEGPKRFNALLRLLPDISRRMLTQSLRDLERDGLVSRQVFDTRPPGVEYRLTDTGRSLMAPIFNLVEWASLHSETVFSAQERFDAEA
jgi:DNA-binding HxlR family transcriptional regulator